MVDAELPVELQHLSRREDGWVGVEHQVEQRRPAMARSGDVDHPHGQRCSTSRSVWLKPPRALPAPLNVTCDNSSCDITGCDISGCDS